MVGTVKKEQSQRVVDAMIKRLWPQMAMPLESKRLWLGSILKQKGYYFSLIPGDFFIAYLVFFVEFNGAEPYPETISVIYGLGDYEEKQRRCPQEFVNAARVKIEINKNKLSEHIARLEAIANNKTPKAVIDAEEHAEARGWQLIESMLIEDDYGQLVTELRVEKRNILGLISKALLQGCKESQKEAVEAIRERKLVKKHLENELKIA